MATNLAAIYGSAEFMKRFHSPDFVSEVSREHASILSVPITGTCEHFMKPANKNLNRSQQHPCWDISRVVLSQTNNGTDYINASYVNGYDQPTKFIATEHPMENNVDNFWTMVWQNTRVIVMLTSAEEKSDPSHIRYFLYNQDDTIISDFIVKKDEIDSDSKYTETILYIINKRTGELRTVHHFKLLDWPEDKTPDVKEFFDFLLAVNEEYQDLRHEALKINRRLPGPIVVHGSKGIGRTSTFIAADSCLYQLVVAKTISVPSAVLKISQQRNFSVPTITQYIFIHMILHCYLKRNESD